MNKNLLIIFSIISGHLCVSEIFDQIAIQTSSELSDEILNLSNQIAFYTNDKQYQSENLKTLFHFLNVVYKDDNQKFQNINSTLVKKELAALHEKIKNEKKFDV